MNIPALSMNMAQIDVGNKVGIAMLSKSLDMAEETGAAMIQMMDQSMELSVNPHLGGSIDLSI
ncbi:MAG: YjfB family protein [Lachnospiraceae bacterium]|nr:YjfB family protein [Lachnospiraceae bacterium]